MGASFSNSRCHREIWMQSVGIWVGIFNLHATLVHIEVFNRFWLYHCLPLNDHLSLALLLSCWGVYLECSWLYYGSCSTPKSFGVVEWVLSSMACSPWSTDGSITVMLYAIWEIGPTCSSCWEMGWRRLCACSVSEASRKLTTHRYSRSKSLHHLWGPVKLRRRFSEICGSETPQNGSFPG